MAVSITRDVAARVRRDRGRRAARLSRAAGSDRHGPCTRAPGRRGAVAAAPAGLLARSGAKLAIENLAPVYLSGREFVCHDPAAVASVVRRLDSEHVGMCLDLGHAHIAADLAGCQLPDLLEPVLDQVALFHVHDNFGARLATPRAGGIEPLKLDLHLSPGAGTVPWQTLRPLLAHHRAPLQLEIHPGRRPVPATLAILAREVLGLTTPVRSP